MMYYVVLILIENICSLSYIYVYAAGQPLEKIAENSPFGMSGALSRPFIADDYVQHEAVLNKIMELKEPYKYVQDIGVKWIRPGIDIGWGSIQPTMEDIIAGRFNWSLIDSVYGRVPAGINILATFSVGHANPGLGIKIGIWEFVNKDVETSYLRFIMEVVERYDGDGYKDMPGLKNPIKYWQTQNEPALVTERSRIPAGNINTDWQGFSHIQEITYRAIKDTDSEAKIAIGGLAGGHVLGMSDHFLRQEFGDFYAPVLRNLQGQYIDIFDIHFYGEPGDWVNNWKRIKNSYEIIRRELDKNGFKNTEIWFTEIAAPSQPLGEKEQAIGLVKRYVYALSLGVHKIFWWNFVEGEYPLEVDKPSNHFGLVYDGLGQGDPGYGVKKLAYYAYKKMVEVLGGINWDKAEVVQEKNGIYAYKFKKKSKSVWVIWSENKEPRQGILKTAAGKVKVTKAVPEARTEKDLKNRDYQPVFNKKIVAVTAGEAVIELDEIPVFIEEINTTL